MIVNEIAVSLTNVPSKGAERSSTPTARNLYLFAHINWLTCLVVLIMFFMVSSCSTLPDKTVQQETTHQIMMSHRMTLSHHEFEPWTFTPRPGDRVVIENQSDIAHAIYITYPDGTVVNMGVQIPETIVTWTVPEDAEGEYLLQCWIHPVIRASLTVKSLTELPETKVLSD